MELQSLSQLAPVQPVQPGDKGSAVGSPGSSSFQNVLSQVIRNANNDQLKADQLVTDFAEGKTDDMQSVVLATAQADLSFRFFLEMRNKLTESYQELSRMQF